MKLTKLNLAALAGVAACFVLAAIFGPSLPDPVPTHWNFSGEADGWTPKPWGVWVLPFITLVLTGTLIVLPVIAPKGFRLDGARRAWDTVLLLIVGFELGLLGLVYATAMGVGPGMGRGMSILIGLLFIAIGNYLTKFPKNFFAGIRTPWTLASDTVWFRTHRLGSWCFVVAGAIAVVGGWLGLGSGALITAVVLAAVIPVLYSLWAYRRLHGFEPDSDA